MCFGKPLSSVCLVTCSCYCKVLLWMRGDSWTDSRKSANKSVEDNAL